MKKQLLVAGLVLISAAGFAQKKEIKKAEKALKGKDAAGALVLINQAEGLISSADADLKTQFYIAKAEINVANAGKSDYSKMKAASEALQKANALAPQGKMADRYSVVKQNLRTALFNSAVDDQKNKDYALAADKLYMSYLSSKKDTADLFYAAGSAYNAKDWKKAVTYYEELVDLGYTGKSKIFTAINKETGEPNGYATAKERDLMITFGTHAEPGVQVQESRVGEILKSIALAYTETGDLEKAKDTYAKARAKDPKNTSLIINEANLYYELGDNEKFRSLMNEASSLEPNNADLVYNIGVTHLGSENYTEALASFEKVLKIDPSYANAALNASTCYLEQANALNKEMDTLIDDNSQKAFARYDALKAEKRVFFKKGVDVLEKFRKDNPSVNNMDILGQLKNVYQALDDQANLKIIEAAMQEGK